MAGRIPGIDLALFGALLIAGGRVRAEWPAWTGSTPGSGLWLGRREMSAAANLLQVEGASKRFGGLLAVDNASLTAEQGRITGLIGPNGAGKTTLFTLISGFERPTSGRILFRGEDIASPAAARAGAARHRADVPDRPALRRPQRAREHRGGRASAPSAAATKRWRGRKRSGRWWASPTGSTRRHPGSPSRAASASNSPARSPPSPPAAARRGARRAEPVRGARHRARHPVRSATAA